MTSAEDLLFGVPHQDYIVLAGFPSPGLAVVRGAGSPRTWDVQKGYGLTGATTIFTGQDLSEFEVDIFLWESWQFPQWRIFSKATLENPPIGGRPTALFLQHPLLNDPPLSIGMVVVKDVSQWEQDPDGSGLWARTIKFLEFRAPRPALVKPREGIPAVGTFGPPPPPPETPFERASRENMATIAAKGGL